MTLSITSYCRNIKMALIAAHLNAEVILVVTVIVATTSIPPPVLPVRNNLYDLCGRSALRLVTVEGAEEKKERKKVKDVASQYLPVSHKHGA